MSITIRLLADHKMFRKLLDDIAAAAAAPPAERDLAQLRRQAGLLKRVVSLHARVEDAVYYPAAAASGIVLPEGFIAHLTQEHVTLDGYLSRLVSQLDAQPPAMSWPQTFALLSSGLKGHLRREEEDLFPAADEALGGAKLEALSVEADRIHAAD